MINFGEREKDVLKIFAVTGVEKKRVEHHPLYFLAAPTQEDTATFFCDILMNCQDHLSMLFPYTLGCSASCTRMNMRHSWHQSRTSRIVLSQQYAKTKKHGSNAQDVNSIRSGHFRRSHHFFRALTRPDTALKSLTKDSGLSFKSSSSGREMIIPRCSSSPDKSAVLMSPDTNFHVFDGKHCMVNTSGFAESMGLCRIMFPSSLGLDIEGHRGVRWFWLWQSVSM